MIFRSTGELPRIGFAGMRAEGFVTLSLPRPLRRLGRDRRRPCPHGIATTPDHEVRTV